MDDWVKNQFDYIPLDKEINDFIEDELEKKSMLILSSFLQERTKDEYFSELLSHQFYIELDFEIFTRMERLCEKVASEFPSSNFEEPEHKPLLQKMNRITRRYIKSHQERELSILKNGYKPSIDQNQANLTIQKILNDAVEREKHRTMIDKRLEDKLSKRQEKKYIQHEHALDALRRKRREKAARSLEKMRERSSELRSELNEKTNISLRFLRKQPLFKSLEQSFNQKEYKELQLKINSFSRNKKIPFDEIREHEKRLKMVHAFSKPVPSENTFPRQLLEFVKKSNPYLTSSKKKKSLVSKKKHIFELYTKHASDPADMCLRPESRELERMKLAEKIKDNEDKAKQYLKLSVVGLKKKVKSQLEKDNYSSIQEEAPLQHIVKPTFQIPVVTPGKRSFISSNENAQEFNIGLLHKIDKDVLQEYEGGNNLEEVDDKLLLVLKDKIKIIKEVSGV